MCKITVIKITNLQGRNPAFRLKNGEEAKPEYRLERTLCLEAKRDQQELIARLTICFGNKYEKLFRRAQKLTLNNDDASDMFLEVLKDVFANPGKWLDYPLKTTSVLVPGCPNFGGAVYTALARRCADEYNRQRPKVSYKDDQGLHQTQRVISIPVNMPVNKTGSTVEDFLPDPTVGSDFDNIIERDALNDAKQQLPERDRDFLDLVVSYHEDDVPYKDAARKLADLSRRDVSTEFVGLSPEDIATKLAGWLPEAIATEWACLSLANIEIKLTNVCRNPTPGNLRTRYSRILGKLRSYSA